MKHAVSVLATVLAALPIAAHAAPYAAVPVLPADTEIMLQVADTVTTKGRTFQEGDTFRLAVMQDVLLDGQVVIPRNATAVGRITWLTSKAAFGKSGKMEVTLEYVDVSGRRLPITGKLRQEGEGNTAGAIGGFLVGAVTGIGGLIGGAVVTGHSAVIPQGHVMAARTTESLRVPYLRRGPATAVRAPQAPNRYAMESFGNVQSRQNWGLVEVTPG